MREMKELLERQLLMQMQEKEEQAEREKLQQREREAEREAAARRSTEEANAMAVRNLKDLSSREPMNWLVHLATVPGGNHRVALVKALLEAMQTIEENGREELEEPNAIIEAATKKVSSLTKEQQEELFKKIKLKKRQVAAAASTATRAGGNGEARCVRCHRTGHTEEDCHAATYAGSGELILAPMSGAAASKMKRGMGWGVRGAAMRGYPYPAFSGMEAMPGYPPYLPAGAGHAPGSLSLSMPPTGPPGTGPVGWATSRPYGGHPAGGDHRRCYTCNQHGHVQANCPMAGPRAPMMPMAPGTHGGVGQPAGAGVRGKQTLRGEERGGEGGRTWQGEQESASARTLGKPAQPAVVGEHKEGEPMAPHDQSVHVTDGCDMHVHGCLARAMDGHRSLVEKRWLRPREVDQVAQVHAATKGQLTSNDGPKSTQHRGEPHAQPIEGEAESTSLASMYAGLAWREEEDDQLAAGMYEACLDSSDTAGKHTQKYECHHDQPSIPVLRQKGTAEEELLACVEWSGMPSRDVSLRRAILAHFQGRKKVLGDEAVLEQSCELCGKRGHVSQSCPDQTQRVEEDHTKEHRWVRRLLGMPRVNVAEVNRGLSVEEGVRRWLERGKEMNRGNPWEGSTRKEDSLRARLGYHKAMGMGSVHLGWIGFGVPLQFIAEQEPAVLAFRNHASALEHEAFVDREHEANLAAGSYVKVERQQLKSICPIQVEKNPTSGKLRLCQDLRWINGHLPNVEFRMESLHTELGDVVKPGDKLITTDIEKAYYCLPMHPSAQPYLGWRWRDQHYMPTCLVFGLSTAPRIFTKIMRPMMAFMRSLGVRVLGMIDDYMWAERPEKMAEVRQAVQQVLPGLGWKLNAKCEWEPSDEVLMLGMLINTKEFVVKAPEKKIQAARANISKVLSVVREGWHPSLKSMQRVTGQLMSMLLALPAVRVYTRGLYRCLAVAQGELEAARVHGLRPSYVVSLSEEAVEELCFWQKRLLTHNGLAISSRETQVEVLLWSDASDVGWGGEAVGVQVGSEAASASTATQLGHQPTGEVSTMLYGSLPRGEIASSSTRRELVGLLELVRTPAILSQVRGKRVKVFMDSIPALRNLINGGGPKHNLTQAVREWTSFCEEHDIRPVYEWVPRAANWRADRASKLHAQQFTFLSVAIEERIRSQLYALVGDRWRQRTNHWLGRVPIFLPMFHQVDARVEMIRSSLEEAIIVVPEWPAGGMHDWYRRVSEHSIAAVEVGYMSRTYKETSRTGHDEKLRAFWLMGRRGEQRQREGSQQQ